MSFDKIMVLISEKADQIPLRGGSSPWITVQVATTVSLQAMMKDYMRSSVNTAQDWYCISTACAEHSHGWRTDRGHVCRARNTLSEVFGEKLVQNMALCNRSQYNREISAKAYKTQHRSAGITGISRWRGEPRKHIHKRWTKSHRSQGFAQPQIRIPTGIVSFLFWRDQQCRDCFDNEKIKASDRSTDI